MPVSAHHKYQQQYVELCRSLAWLGELQLTSTSAERGGATDYMQTIRRLIIWSGRHLTKKLIYNTTVTDSLFLHLLAYNMIHFIVIFICSVVLILIWVWWGGRLHGRAVMRDARQSLFICAVLCAVLRSVLGTPHAWAYNSHLFVNRILLEQHTTQF